MNEPDECVVTQTTEPRGPSADHITVVLVVDTVGSTSMRSALGHERMDVITRTEMSNISQAVAEHGGMVTRLQGDGLMACFPSATLALNAAVTIRRVVGGLNEEMRLDPMIHVRVGISASDVSIVNGELAGSAPIEATRLESSAAPDEIVCSEAVRLLARGYGSFTFEPLGERRLKGLDEPVVVHRLRPSQADVIGLPGSLAITRRFDFVGRDRERATLETAWADLDAGTSRLVAIGGEAGVGKTRLCREVAVQVRRAGAVVLHGRWDEHGGYPYAAFVQALRRFLIRAAEPARYLGPGAAELVRLVPELPQHVTGLPRPRSDDPDTDRFRLFEAVSGWLTEVARDASTLLVLDDLSWADEPSVRLLRHLHERTQGERLLILVTYRPLEMNAHARAFLRDALRTGAAEKMVLSGLGDDEVLQFTRSLLGADLDTDAAGLVVESGRRTGGNPLFLGEVLGRKRERGELAPDALGTWHVPRRPDPLDLPPVVGDLIRSRVDRLPEETGRLLVLAASVGMVFPIALLADLMQMPLIEVVDAAQIAAGDELIHETERPGWFEFTHAVVRDATYAALSPLQRRVQHHRVAIAIERRFAADLRPWIELLAFQFEHGLDSSDATKAIEYLRRAGFQAEARLAHDQAVECYQRAFELLDKAGLGDDARLRCDLLIERGTAERRSGRESWRATLHQAAELSLDRGEGPRAARAVLGSSRGLFSRAGELDVERVGLLERTLGTLGGDPTPLRARLLASLGAELIFDDEPQRAELASDEALIIARQLDDPATLVTVLGLRLVALWRPDRVDERLRLGAELDTLRRLAGERRSGRFLLAMTVYCQVLVEAGRFEAADELLAWIEATAEHLRQPTTVGYAKLRLASRACIAGRFDEAERLAEESYHYCAQAGQPDAKAFHAGQRLSIRYHRGGMDELLDLILATADANPGIAAFKAAAATAAAEAEMEGRCRALFVDVMRTLDAVRFDLTWLPNLAFAANACAFLADAVAAARLRALMTPYRGLFVDNALVFLGAVDHYVALLSDVLGDDATAADAFDAAIKAHAAIPSPPLLARTRLNQAEWLARRELTTTTQVVELARAATDAASAGGFATVERRGRRLIQEMEARDQSRHGGGAAASARG